MVEFHNFFGGWPTGDGSYAYKVAEGKGHRFIWIERRKEREWGREKESARERAQEKEWENEPAGGIGDTGRLTRSS